MTDDRSARERMITGDLYIADDPELREMSLHAADLVAAYNGTTPRQGRLRRELLTELLGAFGEDSTLLPPIRVDYGVHLYIGDRVFANWGLMAADCAEIRVGDDVQIGPGVQLLAPTHPLDPETRRARWEGAEPITVGDNVWLGGGVIVCPGVTIGENTVVGAGAVVTKDLPANVLAVGNPARVIRDLPAGEHAPPNDQAAQAPGASA